ncbi:MAG: acylphosphatase [Parcubacteria group bacterium]|nr:acylphosphatase [Parcubacteria group bacterium]
MQQHCTITVSGLVQGVAFRYSTRGKARELGLSGFVRNERDGTVLIEAEGEEGAIRQLIEWCKNGPTHAQVDDVKAMWGDAQGRYQDFVIER